MTDAKEILNLSYMDFLEYYDEMTKKQMTVLDTIFEDLANFIKEKGLWEEYQTSDGNQLSAFVEFLTMREEFQALAKTYIANMRAD